MTTARVTAGTHSVWHATVFLSTPITMRQGACSEHKLISVEAAEGTAPCWRCDVEAPAFDLPASEQTVVSCEHNHRTPEAAEECGRSLARKHGAEVRRS